MDYSILSKKYPVFIYDSYKINRVNNKYEISFKYEISGLSSFVTKWEFSGKNDISLDILELLVFNLGMAEAISYWKTTCSKEFLIRAGSIDNYEALWWKKLFFKGLGEFQFVNNISFDFNTFIDFSPSTNKNNRINCKEQFSGYLVPVGGGKDSIVTLELLKRENIHTYSINPNKTINNVNKVFSKDENKCINVKRVLDKKVLELNNKGFLNGHIPFSSVVAFSSFITAYLNNIKYIALSNESSANESTVKNSFINHQYSKSFEFEKDFNDYINHILNIDIHYFSMLRPLLEIQIARLFSRYKDYHLLFRSCNKGSKEGIWCNNCSKCLFVYIILSPFLTQNELIKIFGENLLDKKSLESDFLALTGISDNKPFECVGTRKEVIASLKYLIKEENKSYLLDKYKNKISKYDVDLDTLLKEYNNENMLNDELNDLLRSNLY